MIICMLRSISPSDHAAMLSAATCSLCCCTELMQLSMTGVSVMHQGTGEKAWSMDMANV